MRTTAFAPGNVGLDRIMRRLHLAADLTVADEALVRAKAGPATPHVSGALLEGAGRVLAEGWACKARLFANGERQILGFVLPGDPVELDYEFGGRRYCTMALTRGSTIDLTAVEADAGGIQTHVALISAIRLCARRRMTRTLDHLTRLSALSGYQAMGDMLLELHAHSVGLGLSEGDELAMPLSQEVLGEALGMSAVHSNRVLGKLRSDGLVEVGPGWMRFPNPSGLHAATRTGVRSPA